MIPPPLSVLTFSLFFSPLCDEWLHCFCGQMTDQWLIVCSLALFLHHSSLFLNLNVYFSLLGFAPLAHSHTYRKRARAEVGWRWREVWPRGRAMGMCGMEGWMVRMEGRKEGRGETGQLFQIRSVKVTAATKTDRGLEKTGSKHWKIEITDEERKW